MRYAVAAMKTRKNSLVSYTALFALAAAGLSAQSCAVATHASNAVAYSAQASGEAVVASGQLASGVVAVPVMASGAIVKGSGAVLSAIGDSTDAAGTAAINGGEKLWDFASSDPAQRPSLARDKAVPVAPKPPITAAAAKPADPSPAEVLKTTR